MNKTNFGYRVDHWMDLLAPLASLVKLTVGVAVGLSPRLREVCRLPMALHFVKNYINIVLRTLPRAPRRTRRRARQHILELRAQRRLGVCIILPMKPHDV
jgi:hypothetical protein